MMPQEPVPVFVQTSDVGHRRAGGVSALLRRIKQSIYSIGKSVDMSITLDYYKNSTAVNHQVL